MTNRPVRRLSAAVVAGAAISLVTMTLLAGAASAHVEPDPAAAQAGSTTMIQFKVEHGCDGSPTTKIEIKVPAGVSDAAAVAKPGWTDAVAGGVVTYSGGNLGPDTADTFAVSVKLPTAPGSIAFPVVQTCEKGSIDWIEATPPGGAEPEHPAPVVEVTAGAPTSDEVAGSHDAADTGHDEASSGDHDAAASDASGVTDTGLDTVAGDPTKKSDDNTGLIVGGIVAAVVVVAGGLGFTQLRKRSG